MRNQALQVISQTLLGASLSLSLSGCSGSTQNLQASQRVPAASGQLKAKEGKNRNTDVNVKVKHLAVPGAVSAEASTYVVWVQDQRTGQVANVGSLLVDKNLNGQLRTVTPLRNFELFITPERQTAAISPSGEHLLWARVDLD